MNCGNFQRISQLLRFNFSHLEMRNAETKTIKQQQFLTWSGKPLWFWWPSAPKSLRSMHAYAMVNLKNQSPKFLCDAFWYPNHWNNKHQALCYLCQPLVTSQFHHFSPLRQNKSRAFTKDPHKSTHHKVCMSLPLATRMRFGKTFLHTWHEHRNIEKALASIDICTAKCQPGH